MKEKSRGILMKKMLLLTFGLLFSLGIPVNSASEVILSDVLNGFEITRLENYMVYYSYNATGKAPTNQWGYEISVNKNNVVVECNTNVTILSEGYAISGHGTKKTLLMKVKVGDLVMLNKSTKEITITRNEITSSLFLADLSIENAKKSLEEAVIKKIDFNKDSVDSIINLMESSKQLMISESEKAEPQIVKIKEYANVIKTNKDLVTFMTSESNVLEIRALWHRPNASQIKETNLDGIKQFVKQVYDDGFNTIYVETLWNGYVSYRSDFLETHPNVSSFSYGEEYKNDYIAALIGEANKLGIGVHAWCHTFNAGNSVYKAKAVKDEWLLEDYQGNTLHPNVYGGSYYLDPSNPEVISFLESVFLEMVTKYKFDGVQLDYIRYYDNNYNSTPIRDSGYGNFPETKFKDQYQLTGDVRNLILSSSIRNNWNTWRQNQVTEAVHKFSNVMRNKNPKIIISADVVGNINYAKQTYMQDWKTWVEKGYIDLLCPMIYTGSSQAVKEDSIAIKNTITNLSFLSSGIAPIYYGYDVLNSHNQFLATSQTGGSAFFASQNVIGVLDIEESLKVGVFRNRSISPLSNSQTIVNSMIHRSIEYLNKYLDNSQTKDMFLEKLNEILNMQCVNPSDYQKINQKLVFLSNLSAYIENKNIQKNFKQDIDALVNVLDVKISRELIALEFYNPDIEARPNPDDFTYPTPIEEPNDDPGEQNNEKRGCLKLFQTGFVLIGFGLSAIIIKRKER